MLPVYVSVATQTDGVVESSYYELAGSSSSLVSRSLSLLDLTDDDDDNSNGRSFLARRKVMSSQTDLTLSDFDFVAVHDSDDFDDDDDDDNSDEGLDNSFNTYENLTIPSPDESGYSEIGIPNDNSQDKSSQENLLEASCHQFLDFLQIQCDRQSGRRPRGQTAVPDIRDEKPYPFDKENAFIDPVCAQKFTSRIVPKMGTKVDFNRPGIRPSVPAVPHRSPVIGRDPVEAVDTRCCQDQSCVENRPEEGQKTDWSHRDSGNGSCSSPIGAYHSDSEKSTFSNPFSLHRLRDWGHGDEDAKAALLPSSSPEEPSPDPVNDASSKVVPSDQSADFLQRLYEKYAHVMYTNQANLHHTIMVQQRLFEQQIANRIKSTDKSTPGKIKTTIGNTIKKPEGHAWVHGPGEERSNPVEWVIKRRADGTRYITRRPVPSSKDHAGKSSTTAERRCIGVSTDDEFVLTKEERRQHVERTRKRTKESPRTSALEAPPRDPNAVQLKKPKAKREPRPRTQNQGVSFQELLVQHTKINDLPATKTENQLLSVVTI